MSIGGLDGLSVWIERDAPSTRAVAVVIGFLDGIETEPWRAPSVPVHDLSDRPFSEVRSAIFDLEGESSVTV